MQTETDENACQKKPVVCTTYGLNLETLKLVDNTGTDYLRQNNRKSVLLIQDKFCVGEAAYHELTMTSAGEALARSHLAKQCKASLNEVCHIEGTPEQNEGAHLNFTDALQNAIKKHVSYSSTNHTYVHECIFSIPISNIQDGIIPLP